jgi:type I restriction-modification system DNA methylase subunit
MGDKASRSKDILGRVYEYFLGQFASAESKKGGQFYTPNGSMSANQSGEGDIRRALIEADLVDCMIAVPGQLSYSTQIPVCLRFLVKSKAARVFKSLDKVTSESFRARRREPRLNDAWKSGSWPRFACDEIRRLAAL